MQLAITENGKNLEESAQLEMLTLDKRELRLLSDGKVSSVFYRDFCVGTFESGDKFSRNFIFSQLHLSGGFTIRDLAKVFDLQYEHCSRVITRFEREGLAGIRMEHPRVGGRRRLITKKVGAAILEWRGEGKSYEEISEAIRFRFHKKIKASTLKTWVCENRCENKQEEECAKQVEMPVNDLSVIKDSEELEIVEREQENWNGYAGSMILYSMLSRFSFLSSFEQNIKEESGKPKSWGARRVLLTLFFLHALRCRSVEQGKHLVGKDFEEIVGGDFLRLQWLRYATDEIVESAGFERALADFYKSMILSTTEGDKIYYTDGHFSTYYGKRIVPKGYDPRRQMPYRGRNTIYLHNSNGENVFLFESPGNTTLSNDIEVLVKSVGSLGMELNGNTLCFDRGGWSAKCFKSMRAHKMYFISYLKHRKNERLVEESRFETFVVEKEVGDPWTLRIFEKEKRESKYGNVRTIILLLEDGRQIPIITTNPYLKSVDIVMILKRRWREENCFKYSIEHFGIDLLTTYKTEEAPDKIIERAHPERKLINRELAEKKHGLEKLKAELAGRISVRGEKSDATIREFYEQESDLNFKIKNMQVDIDYLERRRKTIPTKERRNLRDDHVIIAQKRRLLLNLIKATNYNVEKWLQEIFEKYHPKKDETLSLIRSLWRQPGRVLQSASTVRVELTPLDVGPMRSTLDRVLENLRDNDWLKLPDGRNLEIIQTR